MRGEVKNVPKPPPPCDFFKIFSCIPVSFYIYLYLHLLCPATVIAFFKKFSVNTFFAFRGNSLPISLDLWPCMLQTWTRWPAASWRCVRVSTNLTSWLRLQLWSPSMTSNVSVLIIRWAKIFDVFYSSPPAFLSDECLWCFLDFTSRCEGFHPQWSSG